MAYGRLDVIYPDGNFRSFPLEESKVSVGRSPGNTITLDTETISRYHFSIIHEDGNVYLKDMESQNGTYVDMKKIPDDERLLLRGGEEILAGELRIIFYEVDEMPTQPVMVEDMTTQPITKKDVPFRISIQPPPIAIPPSAHASAELTIDNMGEDRAFYNVAVEGIEPDWVRIDRPKLMIDGNDSARVIINVRPVRRPDTAPGRYDLKVEVRDQNNPTDMLQTTTHVNVLPYYGFGAALEHRTVKSSERFRLHIHNQGSVDLPLVISGGDRTKDVDIELVSSSSVTLRPNQHLVVQGQAKPAQQSFFGASEAQPFDLVVRSQDAAQFMVVVPGRVLQTPVMPVWAAIAGVVALVGVLGLLLLLTVISVFTAADPRIVSASIPAPQIARGEPLAINYTVEEVNELELLVDGTPIATFDPADNGEYVLSAEQTAALPDAMSMSLVGRSGRRTSTFALGEALTAYDPLNMVTFEATPEELVRFVVQPLTLAWEIENASQVQIDIAGLESYASDPAENFDPAGSLEDILDIPLEDVVISIRAEGPAGNTLTDQATIAAVLPQCQPVSEDVTLYAGPNPLNQEIGTVPESASVIVDGRDVSGAWIRVRENGGWGALEAFECASVFNPAELRQIVDVIPPPQQPTALPVTPTPGAGDTGGTVPTEPSPLTITPGALVPADATPQPTSAG
ncbi:MAG: FHA domain-containing protein [Chloroflexota bacterium]